MKRCPAPGGGCASTLPTVAPVPLGCASTTVELRSQTDVSDALATQDAQAIMGYLRHVGVLAGPAPALPEALCEATPLAGTESLHAPHPGVVVFVADVGERVQPRTSCWHASSTR